MNAQFEYYYNHVPGKGLCRNNLIYTSLISKDKKTFCQWYHNDTEYHQGQNQVVDPELMEEKWEREVEFLFKMSTFYPQHVPEILNIDYNQKKIYLKIDGVDLWERNGCTGNDYTMVLSDWDKQFLEIIQSHQSLGIYKMSVHPSSFFLVDGKLKSINYFFCYTEQDTKIRLQDLLSHISQDRQTDLIKKMANIGLDFDSVLTFTQLQHLAFDTFTLNFRKDVMEKAKAIYS